MLYLFAQVAFLNLSLALFIKVTKKTQATGPVETGRLCTRISHRSEVTFSCSQQLIKASFCSVLAICSYPPKKKIPKPGKLRNHSETAWFSGFFWPGHRKILQISGGFPGRRTKLSTASPATSSWRIHRWKQVGVSRDELTIEN